MFEIADLVEVLTSNLDHYDDGNDCFYNVTTQSDGKFQVNVIDINGEALSTFTVEVTQEN